MKTIPLSGPLGLMVNVHESLLPDGALSAGENFDVSDGPVRLAPRYILVSEISAGSRTPQGSGWGVFGANQEYLLVSNQAMHFATTPSASSWTAVTGAGSLSTGNYFFQQFGQFIYSANATDGLGRKTIGTNSWTALSLPTAPTSAPTAPVYQPPSEAVSYVGGTASNSGLSSATVDAQGRFVLTSTTAGSKSATITFDTSPDLRPNHQYRDIIEVPMIAFGYPAPFSAWPRLTVIEGATETEAILWYADAVNGRAFYRMQNIARGNRDQVTAWRFNWDAPSGTTQLFIYPGRAYGVWLSVDSSANPGSGFAGIRKPLEYEYTFYNSTTGFESAPSPRLTVAVNAQSVYGEWRTVTGTTSAQAGVDKVRFYRVVNEGGVLTRYRLAEVNNTGTPSYLDKLPVDEVLALPVYSPSVLPTSGITAITAWQNRLVLGVGTLCYISQEDDEIKFEPQSGAYDPFNPARGLTFYPDDRKAESILALVGQDDLYIGTGYSIRAVFGSSPDNWRLIKLPDIEGVAGPRAMTAYKKGILALTPSGRLLYHHTSLAEPVDIGDPVQGNRADSGIAEMATSDVQVSVTPDGEIWVTNSTGRYYVRDVDGRWRRGTFTHGVHSHLFISGLSLRWIGSNGKLYQGGVNSYVTDGGTTGTNGTAVTFSATTNRIKTQRARADNLYFGDATGTSPYPRITVFSQETPSGTVYSKTAGAKNKRTKISDRPIGEWMKFKMEGDKDTVFDDVRVELYDVGQARNK